MTKPSLTGDLIISLLTNRPVTCDGEFVIPCKKKGWMELIKPNPQQFTLESISNFFQNSGIY
jgi:hypothetical protein